MQRSLPNWDHNGILPPIKSTDPTGAERSPYPVTLEDFVRRYCINQPRHRILVKLLDYRNALHRIGLTSGFQWLDGSFLENIEVLEQRSPEDIDIVTFYHLPPNKTQKDVLNTEPELFDRDLVRSRFLVDRFVVGLDSEDPAYLVRATAYWYSVWAHRRDLIWKGFVQVDLSPEEDERARHLLSDDLKFGGDVGW